MKLKPSFNLYTVVDNFFAEIAAILSYIRDIQFNNAYINFLYAC